MRDLYRVYHSEILFLAIHQRSMFVVRSNDLLLRNTDHHHHPDCRIYIDNLYLKSMQI